MNYKITQEQKAYIDNIWKLIQEKMDVESERNSDIIPFISVNGRYEDMGKQSINWWTNGFWAGIMWQMYHGTKDLKYKEIAEKVEKRLDEALDNYDMLDHDVGFMWLHTAVANYRLTGNKESRTRGLKAASILASRYNLEGKYIRAWNGPESSMIIDCMMNLPLLYWAREQVQDPRFRMIGKNHSDTTLKYIIREDGSCNHVVEFDPNTGEYLNNPVGQGYEQGSSWSRGQSWAIYGMALAYRYLGDEAYLNAAKRVAHYFIANVALTAYIPLIDFRAPEEPVYYDTTAGACAACGLLELSQYVSEHEKKLYVEAAFNILKSMNEKHCDYNKETDGILGYGSGKYHRESDRHVPIIYGDYFLIELVLRFLNKEAMLW
ncbi:MAG: glycosyl hydrolase family 88 [Clostridiales bacterium]|nr:glycosyl hydrolase family 88 [Clostridiales bacterium]